MIAFIDQHRSRFGVEPICRVLPIAPSTYFVHAARQVDPGLRSARARRDAALLPEVQRVHRENFGVYGVRKVWHQLRPERFVIARCTTARLMEHLGLSGVLRGKQPRTTVSDVFARRIVGWRVASTTHADFVLDALGQVLYERRSQAVDRLVSHSDRGSQYNSIRYTRRLAEAGIEPSVGSVGDSYDNALAEPPPAHRKHPPQQKPRNATTSKFPSYAWPRNSHNGASGIPGAVHPSPEFERLRWLSGRCERGRAQVEAG